MTPEQLGFYALAATALGGAMILIIGARSTVGAAVGAVITSLSFVGLFALLAAPFLALAQLLLVVGAALAGLLFVVLLVDLEASRLPARSSRRRVTSVAGAVAAAALSGFIALSLSSMDRVDLDLHVDLGLGGYWAMSQALFGDFVAPMLVLALIVLTAIVGAMVFGSAGAD
jgi:NADH:ubiquinone oxidoreductase subunit 6 (subunit J)